MFIFSEVVRVETQDKGLFYGSDSLMDLFKLYLVVS